MNKKLVSLLLAWTLVLSGLLPAAYAGQALAEPSAPAAAASSAAGNVSTLTAAADPVPPAVTDDVYKVSMTEARTLNLQVTLPEGAEPKDIVWNFGRTAAEMKPIAEWKKWDNNAEVRNYTGAPFVTVDYTTVSDSVYRANIHFGLPYGPNLSLSGIRSEYVKRIGIYDLVASVGGTKVAEQKIKLNAYDSYHTYDEIKPAIDAITAKAINNRYIEYQNIGTSTQGRAIHFSIVAKDKASVDQYLNETLPLMTSDPAALQAKIKSGELKDYKVPVWLNNIHADEANGVDAIIKFFDTLATEKFITYDTTDDKKNVVPVTLDIDKALDDVIFLLDYVENPDGRALNTRATSTLLDPNRDNSYQTQPETQAVTAQIAKWTPLSFLDFHGFVSGFLIEPCTPPHDPNIEYDIVINSMKEQAHAIGNAGVANTNIKSYLIPYEESEKLRKNPSYSEPGRAYATGWDDASPAYTAVYAMHHGALGHTIEVPELNEDSLDAFYYGALNATKYVMDNKNKLFANQLEIFKRGINNEDNRAVDEFLINAKYEEIGRPRKGSANFFPEYYVLPVNKSLQKNELEVYRMVQYLLRNNVKVEQTTEPVVSGGVTYPAGTYIVNMHQAKRGYANLVLYDGLDVSDFNEMYSDTVQNFADMRGFDRYVITEAGTFNGKTKPVTEAKTPVSGLTSLTAESYIIRNSNNDAIKAVNELLAGNKTVTLLTYGGQGYEKGSFLVSRGDLQSLAKEQGGYLLDLVPASVYADKSGKQLQAAKVAIGGAPSFILKDLGFSVTSNTASADVLVNSGTNLIASGKPFIGYGRSILSTLRTQKIIPGLDYKNPVTAEGYTAAHEGLFKAALSQTSVITAPYAESEYLYTVSAAYITGVPEGAEILAKYGTGDDFFKAGWWPNSSAAKDQVLALSYKKNNMNVTLFANDLLNKYHPQNQFRLLANAIYAAGPGTEVVIPGAAVPDTGGPVPAPTASPSPSPSAAPAPSATPAPTATPAPVFSDLGKHTWAASAIQELTAKGIINGVGGNAFAPAKQVTRAEFIAMIVRAFGLLDPAASASFTDVNGTDWSYSYIASGVENGLISGVGGGRFEPKRAVTREEMAIIAANALKKFKGKTVDNADQALAGFKDKDSIASYGKEAVALLTQEGVVNGLTGDTFGPKGIANRAQAAVIISKLINLQ